MLQFRLFFRDFIRFRFNGVRNKSIRDISIWKVPFNDLNKRKNALSDVSTWLEKQSKNELIVRPSVHKTFPDNWVLTEKMISKIANSDDQNFKHFYVTFSKRKYLPYAIDLSGEFHTKIISLKSYAIFSKLLLDAYMETKNIQFLNTSLKVNDFIIYCQIKNHSEKFNGAIYDYFPCWHNHSVANGPNLETNELFAQNIKREIVIIEDLSNEQ